MARRGTTRPGTEAGYKRRQRIFGPFGSSGGRKKKKRTRGR